MRLAMVVNAFPTVSETFVVNKALALRDAGVEVRVHALSPRSDAPFFADRIPDGGAGWVEQAATAAGLARLPFRAGARAARAPGLARALWARATALHGPGKRALAAWTRALPLAAGAHDVIHFEFSGLAADYLDALPLLAPARLVVSCRGTAEKVVPLLDDARARRLGEVFRRVDRVHCVSEDMARTVAALGLPAGKAFVNRPSVDAERFRRARPPRGDGGPLRLLATGRLHWIKGLDLALVALRRAADRGCDAALEVVGAGPEEEKLRFMAHALGLAGRVRFHGRQPAAFVRERLEEADVYLLPSLSEGISNAALEAMAMEVPVIASAVGGMPEAVADGVEGRVVAPADPDALAAAIAELAADPARRRAMGRAGRARVETEFTLPRQTARFLEEYRALTRGEPGGER